MDRRARALLFLAFAFVDFFMLQSTASKALGVIFLVFAIYLFATGRKLNQS